MKLRIIENGKVKNFNLQRNVKPNSDLPSAEIEIKSVSFIFILRHVIQYYHN